MGSFLRYPELDDEHKIQIYNESCDKRIWGLGYFVDFASEHNKAFPISKGDGLPHNLDEEVNFTYHFKRRLLATGAQVVLYPVPSELRNRSATYDKGWLVILTTGFDKTAHVPVDNDITGHVKYTLDTTDDPTWWPMRGFLYTPVKCKSLFYLKKAAPHSIAQP